MDAAAVAPRRGESPPARRPGQAPVVRDGDLRRRLLELLAVEERPRMTYEEFLAWADEDTLAEWVDGEVVMYSPASLRHQEINGFLSQVIGLYVEQQKAGQVLLPPFQMKLDALHGREPDLLFVATEHLDRLRNTYLDGPADLVIEITSSESLARDRGEKFYEYAQGGVPEYWLIDPDAQWAEFYHLGEDRRYRPAFVGAEGIYRSRVLPGFWLRVEWLWQEPLPHPLRALGEIAGLEPQVVERFLQALAGSAETLPSTANP